MFDVSSGLESGDDSLEGVVTEQKPVTYKNRTVAEYDRTKVLHDNLKQLGRSLWIYTPQSLKAKRQQPNSV